MKQIIQIDSELVYLIHVANKMEEKPFDIIIRSNNNTTFITIENDEIGLKIINNIQTILQIMGFDKDYNPLPIGIDCEKLIDIFYEYNL